MSFIKRLLAEFTGELEASMTKKPSAQGGLGVRISRHYSREFLAGLAQQKGYARAMKHGATSRSKGKSAESASGGRRAADAPETNTQSTRTRPARPARTRPARPARPARTRPARSARTRKKPSKNDDDK